MAELAGVAPKRIDFVSGGEICVGYWYEPAATEGQHPCVVLGHGFTGTQDRLAAAAQRFAEKGLAALTFDYRNFGESGGKTRQVIRIGDQLEDFRNAIAFARRQPNVDANRIGLWGSSLGGGHVITLAAEDPTIAAVVAQIPYNGFPRRVEGRSTLATLRLLLVMVEDALRGRLGLPPHFIKAVGRSGELAAIASEEAQEAIEAMQSEQWKNAVAPRALLEMLSYHPGAAASKIQARVRVYIALLDKFTPIEKQEELTAAPRVEMKRLRLQHFDFYRPGIRESLIEDQANFYRVALLRPLPTVS